MNAPRREAPFMQARILRSFPRSGEYRKAVDFLCQSILILMAAAPAAMAQTGGGATLVGTVRDSTGSVVPQAKVTVVNTATAFVTETTTGTDGSYYVPYLIPGDYRVKVNAAGFKEFVR